MTKDVLLKIRGLQYQEGAGDDYELQDSIETLYPGTYFYKNQAHYILYEDRGEESDMVSKNLIKLKGKELTITRKGDVHTQMLFMEEQKTMSNYLTPFGEVLIGLDTSSVEVEESEDLLHIRIAYTLEANYQFVSDSHIDIEVKARA